MAQQKPTKPGAAPPAEPVNGEQLEQQQAQEAAAPGPSIGELEERTVIAEERADAAERQNAQLAGELEELRRQVAVLMSRPQQARRDLEEVADPDAIPVFDENQPHGIVVGDVAVAYVQNGHQFGRDRQYLATEKHRGCGRPFNPRLVGLTKPRPGQSAVDALDGIRDRNDR